MSRVSRLGPPRRVPKQSPERQSPAKQPRQKQSIDARADWSFSVSDLDAYKLSEDDQKRRKERHKSKHVRAAKQEVDRRLCAGSKATPDAIEALVPKSKDPLQKSTPVANFGTHADMIPPTPPRDPMHEKGDSDLPDKEEERSDSGNADEVGDGAYSFRKTVVRPDVTSSRITVQRQLEAPAIRQ